MTVVAFLDRARFCDQMHPSQLLSEQAGPMPDPSKLPATLLKDFLNGDWVLPWISVSLH